MYSFANIVNKTMDSGASQPGFETQIWALRTPPTLQLYDQEQVA